MRRSSVLAIVAGLNFGSAAINFLALINAAAHNDWFALVNMIYVFLGITLGILLMTLSEDAAARGE